DEAALIRLGERAEQLRDLVVRARAERGERRAARRRERQVAAATIVVRPCARDQPAALEAAQQAAQVACVDAELAAELAGRRRGRTMGQLVEHAHFGEREVTAEIVQDPDPGSVEAIEASYRRHVSLELGPGRHAALRDS